MQKEAALQRACCHYLLVCCPEVVFWHNANAQVMSGLVRNLFIKIMGREAGMRAAMRVIGTIVNSLHSLGLKPGVPDLTMHWTLGFGCGTAYVEFKSATGKLSPDQLALHERLNDLHMKVHTIRSLDEFRELVAHLRMPCRDAYAPKA
jgi:hypothetical protein